MRSRKTNFLLRLLVTMLLVLGNVGSASSQTPALRVDAATTAHSLVGSLDYLEDPGGRLGLPEVKIRAAEFKPTDPVKGVNFGYSASAYWFRFAVDAAEDAPNDWLLEIAYPPLDSIDVYFVSRGVLQHLHAGDLVTFAERPVAHRNFVFPLNLPAGKSSEVLFRVTSNGTLTVPATFWRPDAFARSSEAGYAMFSLYFGWLIALGLYNLMLYFSTRERVFLTYVSFVLCFAVASMAYTGMAAQYLWPDWPWWGDLALPIGLAMAIFFGTRFTREFLGTDGGAKWLDRVLTIVIWASAATVFLPVLISLRIATILLAMCGFAFSLTGLLAGIWSFRRRHPGSRFFLTAWGVFFLGALIFSLRNTGLLPTNAFTLYVMQIGSALEMLLLSFALADRMNTLRRDKEQAQQVALEAKQTLVETLKRSEAELEQRVAQRTHDLETANLRLRESEDLLRTMAHHDALTGLANRLLLQAQLDQAFKRTRRSGQRFALMMVDLDGFKSINDQHGHEAGDCVLRETASRLKAAVRETDLVARVGGDEFVCVLESVGDAETAMSVGSKLVGEIRRPVSLANGAAVHVGGSIGIALFSEKIQSADQLVRLADSAMYAAKTAGKNRCHLAAES